MGWPYNTTATPMTLRSQEITFTTASTTAFTAVPDGCVRIRIAATQDLYYEVASSATVSKSVWLPARMVEYVNCGAGNIIYIQGYSTAGRAFLTPCSG